MLKISKIMRICMILILGFLIIFAGYSMYRNLIDENLRKETMVSGDKIVKGLESYFLKYNKYPDSLNELIPEYLDKIPKAKWGEGWRYESDSKSFWIETGYKDVLGGEDYYPSLHYFHEEKKWILDS